jgi:hypothetical protein
MQNDWRSASVAAYMDGKEWDEVYSLFPDVKPSAIRSHIRRSMEYRELHPKLEQPKRTNTLIVSDLHYPFHRKNIVEEVSQFAGQIDTLLISEEQDCQGISKFQALFRKNIMTETVGTRQLLIDIMEAVKPKRTVVIWSNHPARVGTHLCRVLGSDMLRFSPSTSSERIIDEGFFDHDHETKTKVWYEPLKNLYPIEYINEYYYKIGKHVYCHPSKYKSPIMQTVEYAGNYFIKQFRDIDSVSIAHTHHGGAYPDSTVFLYETGCCCEPCNYRTDDMKRPWSFALFLLVQDENGNNMKNETRHIWLD